MRKIVLTPNFSLRKEILLKKKQIVVEPEEISNT